MTGNNTATDIVDGTVEEVRERLETYDGDLRAVLEAEKKGENRKTAKEAIRKEIERRGETPEGLPTPSLGNVELPEITWKDGALLLGVIAAVLILPYFTYQGSTLDTTEDVVQWLETNRANTSSAWCRNFTTTFKQSNTTFREEGGVCDCYPAEDIPEDRIAVEQLVREHAKLRAIVVCTLNGEDTVLPYWETPSGSGVHTTK